MSLKYSEWNENENDLLKLPIPQAQHQMNGNFLSPVRCDQVDVSVTPLNAILDISRHTRPVLDYRVRSGTQLTWLIKIVLKPVGCLKYTKHDYRLICTLPAVWGVQKNEWILNYYCGKPSLSSRVNKQTIYRSTLDHIFSLWKTKFKK